MDILLNEFKTVLQDKLIELIWNQWCIMGVQGNSDKKSRYWIDPEALILFTCSIGRREPRLFDEMLDWLNSNYSYINIPRLNSLVNANLLSGIKLLGAVAASIPKSKWETKIKGLKKNSTDEPLFFFKDGKPMQPFGESDAVFKKYGYLRGPINRRGYSMQFDLHNPSSLIMSLRAFLGVNARSEILLYLITHQGQMIVNPTQLAKEITFAQKTVQTVLMNMWQSGYIIRHLIGRETLYGLRQELKDALLLNVSKSPVWLNWVSIYTFFDDVFNKIFEPEFDQCEPVLQIFELREIIKKHSSNLSSCGLDETVYLGGPTDQSAFLDWFSNKILKIVNLLLER